MPLVLDPTPIDFRRRQSPSAQGKYLYVNKKTNHSLALGFRSSRWEMKKKLGGLH